MNNEMETVINCSCILVGDAGRPSPLLQVVLGTDMSSHFGNVAAWRQSIGTDAASHRYQLPLCMYKSGVWFY